MDSRLIAGVAAWLFPGAGHVYQGRLKRGLLIGGAIWLMFAIAIHGGGAYYPGLEWEEGPLLYLLNVFSRLGNITGAVISYAVGMNAPPNVAEWATYEYGGRFLEVAGLLNYLSVLDAVDESGDPVE